LHRFVDPYKFEQQAEADFYGHRLNVMNYDENDWGFNLFAVCHRIGCFIHIDATSWRIVAAAALLVYAHLMGDSDGSDACPISVAGLRRYADRTDQGILSP